MGFSRKMSLLILAAVLPLLLTACPQPGKGGPAGGSASTAKASPAGDAGVTPAGTETATTGQPVVDDGLDFSFTTFDGAEHRLSDYRGKPVVVNFFGVT